MSVTDEVLKANQAYAQNFNLGNLPLPPAHKLAVVACMDARLIVSQILGLKAGDAHIIRNAGGIVTEDALRSLIISHELLGTQEFIIINHTDCGMLTFKDEDLRSKLQKQTGTAAVSPVLVGGPDRERVRVPARRADRVVARTFVTGGEAREDAQADPVLDGFPERALGVVAALAATPGVGDQRGAHARPPREAREKGRWTPALHDPSTSLEGGKSYSSRHNNESVRAQWRQKKRPAAKRFVRPALSKGLADDVPGTQGSSVDSNGT